MDNPFLILKPWISSVLGAIKKELRTDHLVNSPSFARAHFGNRPLNRVSAEEIYAAYEKDLVAGNEELTEWVINRWVFRHPEIYTHFADRLEKIDPNYGEMEKLTLDESEMVLAGAEEKFGALMVYLFSVLNQVVFPEGIVEKLRIAAEKEKAESVDEAKRVEEKESFERLKERLENENKKLEEKYEKKIEGVMKKYQTDIEGFKKQIRALQRQLQTK